MVRFTSSKRLLIASDLSLRSVERLSLVQQTIETSAPRDAKFRWVDPNNIRADLLFMDNIEPTMVPFIVDALSRIVAPLFPFELSVERVFAGPTRKHPRYFYAGLDSKGGEVMGLLRLMLEKEFANFGLVPPKQDYEPSIFLGRGLSNFDSRRSLKKVRNLSISKCYIRDLSLFEAVNEPLAARTDAYNPPTYFAIQRFTLGSSRHG